jgi:hypothetical protein
MIRRILLIAVAITMPVAAVTALVGGGVAAAKKGPLEDISCAQTGTVTFPTPGLNYDGYLTKKTSEKSDTSINGTGTGCSTKAVKVDVVSDNTKCPNNSGPPEACTGDIAKDPYYYDDTAGFTGSSTLTDIDAAFPIKTQDNGNNITLETPTSSSTEEPGSCSTTVGFLVSGPTSAAGYNYSELVCLTTDTGTDTTNNFTSDLGSSSGGDASIVIATAGIGGKSLLTISN